MKKIFLLALVLLLSSCGKIDNLMLGKDNTPAPAPLKTVNPTLDVNLPWSTNAGDGTDGNYLEMAPAVDTDSVYTADIDGKVIAFDRKTGQKRWVNDLDMHLLSGPIVGGSYLAVTNKDAEVLILDAQTGKQLWKKTVSNEVFAPVTLAEGKVFVKTVDGNLYAFDLENGKRLWRYNHGTTPLIMRAGSSPQVVFGVVVAGFPDGKLVGLRADSGQLLWEKVVATPQGVSDVERIADIDSNPIIMDGMCYVASYQQNLSALSLQSGEFIWQKNDISTFINMAASSTTLYVVDDESIVWAIDRESGTVLWQLKALHNRGLTAPAIVDDKALVVGDFQGYVSWLSLEDGSVIARTRPNHSAIYATPVVDGNDVYILTSDGKLANYQVP